MFITITTSTVTVKVARAILESGRRIGQAEMHHVHLCVPEVHWPSLQNEAPRILLLASSRGLSRDGDGVPADPQRARTCCVVCTLGRSV